MTTARGRLAVLAAFSLAGVVALVPTAPAVPPAPAPKAGIAAVGGDKRPAPQLIFAGMSIGVVLEANGNEVPKSGEQMMKVLDKLGDFAQLPVTFSAVDLQSGGAEEGLTVLQIGREVNDLLPGFGGTEVGHADVVLPVLYTGDDGGEGAVLHVPADSQHLGDPSGNIGIAREITVDLERERERGEDDIGPG